MFADVLRMGDTLCSIHNIFRDTKRVKITTTKRTSTTEMEQPTRTLVIFGALETCVRENLFQLMSCG